LVEKIDIQLSTAPGRGELILRLTLLFETHLVETRDGRGRRRLLALILREAFLFVTQAGRGHDGATAV
jgi:hypothetical protein